MFIKILASVRTSPWTKRMFVHKRKIFANSILVKHATWMCFMIACTTDQAQASPLLTRVTRSDLHFATKKSSVFIDILGPVRASPWTKKSGHKTKLSQVTPVKKVTVMRMIAYTADQAPAASPLLALTRERVARSDLNFAKRVVNLTRCSASN